MGKLRPGESLFVFFISLDEIPLRVSIPWYTHCGDSNIMYSVGAGRIKGLIPIKCFRMVLGTQFLLFHSLLHKGPMNSIFQVRKQVRKGKKKKMIKLWIWNLNLKCLCAHLNKSKMTIGMPPPLFEPKADKANLSRCSFPLNLDRYSESFSISKQGCTITFMDLRHFCLSGPLSPLRKHIKN